MKKIRVTFSGTVDIDAEDILFTNLSTNKDEKASDILARGENLCDNHVMTSFADVIKDSIDGDYEELSCEVVEEE